MRSIKDRILAAALAAALALGCMSAALAAETATATNMRLTKTEGTVTITNSSGRGVSILKNLLLRSGYRIQTEKSSYAWISLDGTKLVKTDAVSDVEVRKSGKKLEVLVNEGSLFFDVTEPLKDDESLNIRTSTLVAGIRGTCGVVKIVDENTSRLSVLEGTVHVSVADPVTGETRTGTVTAGETALCSVLPENDTGSICVIETDAVRAGDVDGFVLVEAAADETLQTRILEGSGLDLTEEDPAERLGRDQAAVEEKLREAAARAEAQAAQTGAQADDEVSVPVWTMPRAEEADHPIPTPPRTGGSSGGSGGSGGGGGSQPSPSPVPSESPSPSPDPSESPDPSPDPSESPSPSPVPSESPDPSPDPSESPSPSPDPSESPSPSPDPSESPDPSPSPSESAAPTYTVMFDANGGTVTPAAAQTGTGSKLTGLPTPTTSETGKVFGGWYTAASGGTRVIADQVYTADTTLYAHWVGVAWDYDPGTKKLTIKGTGMMEDIEGYVSNYPSDLSIPWSAYISDIETVVIESGVSTIARSGFEGCTSLTSVSIPTGVRVIDSSAFNGCSGLTSIAIPSTVDDIGNNVFNGCTGLTSVTVPAASALGTNIFYGCTSLGSVTFTSGLTAINDGMFQNCTSLTSVEIPSGVTGIGYSAFSGCTALTSVEIPSGVTTIGNRAFYNCKVLPSVNIPATVTAIGDEAFSGCSVLNNVTIPTTVTRIGSKAFSSCWALTSIELPTGLTTLGESAFDGCQELAGAITIPGDVTIINNYTFRGCQKLTSVTISENVTGIGQSVFSSCTGLKTVTLPSSITSIGESAFFGCTGLTTVTYGGTEAQWNAITIGTGNTSLKNKITGITNDTHTYSYAPVTSPARLLARGAAPDYTGAPLLASLSLVPTAPADTPVYTDVPADAWYAEAAAWCRDRGLMVGTSGSAFSPEDSMTRAMMAVVLHRLAGSPGDHQAAFPDVAGDAWYAGAVSWAGDQKLMIGYSDGNFGPDDPVTHAQVNLIFRRYSGDPTVQAVSGDTPNAPATRAELAAALMKFDGGQTLPPGTLSEYSVMDLRCAPSGLALAEDGSLLVTDTYSKRIWQVKNRSAEVYAGGGTAEGLYGQSVGGYRDAGLTDSWFGEPWAIAPFLDGWAVTDASNHVVRLIQNGRVRTLNGASTEGLETAKNGVIFHRPTGLAADDQGNLYISDTFSGAVRRVTPQGGVTTVAAGLTEPMGLCWSAGALYIAETGANRVMKLEDNKLTVLAGSGQEGAEDGRADRASFSSPQGVAVGEDGSVYVADTCNSAIRQVKDGTVTTLAVRAMETTDPGLVSPTGLLVRGDRLYISDPFAGKVFVYQLR